MWSGYLAPFMRKHEHAEVGDEVAPVKELMIGTFGLIPHCSKDEKSFVRPTMLVLKR